MIGKEVDLLCHYPKTKRNLNERADEKTDEDRRIAREYGKDFFDGDRRHGYGGFSYQSRFWEPVIPDLQQHFGLTAESSVLDVGCAKGFMLYDMQRLIPGIKVAGVDVSEYAIANAMDAVKPFLQVADAKKLPFDDNSFDVVTSITTVHNLERDDLALALQEIERVAKHGSFITVDAWRNEKERRRLESWVLTAKTMMHVEDWKAFFSEIGYTGDFYWFIP